MYYVDAKLATANKRVYLGFVAGHSCMVVSCVAVAALKKTENIKK
jgi:hypothetical protein